MIAFVDYDNFTALERRKGIANLVTKVVSAVASRTLGRPARIHFRLYGGWYERSSLTRKAQHVASDAAAVNGSVFPFVDSAGTTIRPQITIELAYSLLAHPRQLLFSTFRPRGYPQGLRGNALLPNSCGNPKSCPHKTLAGLLQLGACDFESCSTSVESLINRAEQKLVDTMMVADIIHAGLARTEALIVVSSDDDMWPAIQMVTHASREVIHVHTRPGYRTKAIYSRLSGPKYTQTSI